MERYGKSITRERKRQQLGGRRLTELADVFVPDLLDHIRKPDMDFNQIETMYGIDQARVAHEKIKPCTTGKKMKVVKEGTLPEVRVALKNCLGLIDDLREG